MSEATTVVCLHGVWMPGGRTGGVLPIRGFPGVETEIKDKGHG